MKVLLDTDICIAIIRDRPTPILERLARFEIGEVGLSSITVAELQYGAEKSRQQKRNRAALGQFLLPFVIAPFDHRAAIVYGRVRTELESDGRSIGPLDTLIGAHALELDVTLITNNICEFARISELRTDSWRH